MIPLVPESARFYLAKGKDDKAQKVMARIAWFNCTEVPPGRVVSTEEKLRSLVLLNGVRNSDINSDENGSSPNSGQVMPNDSYKRQFASRIKKNFSHLLSNGMWKTTLMLVLLWMGTGWPYYGIVMSTTSLLQYNPIPLSI